MGDTLEHWRGAIGCFLNVSYQSGKLCHASPRRNSLRQYLLLAVLLLIAGIEPNPGLKMDDIIVRLDALCVETKATKDAMNNVTVKLDQLAADFSAKLEINTANIAALDARIKRLESMYDDLKATVQQHVTVLSASGGDDTDATASGAHRVSHQGQPSSSVNDIVKELSDRDRRRLNVVLSGIRGDLEPDIDKVKKLFVETLQVNVTVVSCKRLGVGDGQGGKPRPLLIKLATDTDVRQILKSASKLRLSQDDYIKRSVFLNADMTKTQREERFKLREERRQRAAAGERDLVIRGGRVQPRSNGTNAH